MTVQPMQSIETAPQSTPILLYIPDARRESDKFQVGQWNSSMKDGSPLWIIGNRMGAEVGTPSHWAPLPLRPDCHTGNAANAYVTKTGLENSSPSISSDNGQGMVPTTERRSFSSQWWETPCASDPSTNSAGGSGAAEIRRKLRGGRQPSGSNRYLNDDPG